MVLLLPRGLRRSRFLMIGSRECGDGFILARFGENTAVSTQQSALSHDRLGKEELETVSGKAAGSGVGPLREPLGRLTLGCGGADSSSLLPPQEAESGLLGGPARVLKKTTRSLTGLRNDTLSRIAL